MSGKSQSRREEEEQEALRAEAEKDGICQIYALPTMQHTPRLDAFIGHYTNNGVERRLIRSKEDRRGCSNVGEQIGDRRQYSVAPVYGSSCVSSRADRLCHMLRFSLTEGDRMPHQCATPQNMAATGERCVLKSTEPFKFSWSSHARTMPLFTALVKPIQP